MKSNNTIQVALRKRPLFGKELDAGKGAEVVQIINDKQINLLDADEISRQYYLNFNVNKNRFKETHFTFDAVFDENASNQDLYAGVGSVLLKDLLDGFNTTIFAYGATGAGKTYTMIGQKDIQGFTDMMLEGVFERAKLKEQTHDVKIRMAYMEIYNENLKDLLSSDSKNLDLREDPKSDLTQVHGLTEVEVSDPSQINGILRIGARNRSKDSTVAHEASSRSHAIIQIQVECIDRAEGLEKEIIMSKLSLVDLAGSERAWANKSKASKQEGAKINQSLLTLGNCISALSEINEKGPSKSNFVPFRGSKLTRLLKDSLGGNCRTVMIANISGSILCFEDTYNTLQYASRAKNIKQHISKNVIQTSNHVSNFAQIIENLNKENENLRNLINGEKTVIPRSSFGHNANNSNQSDPHQLQIQEQLEQMIKTHFDDEAGYLRTISENQLKLDKMTRINTSYHSEVRRLSSTSPHHENISNLKEQLMINAQGMTLVANSISDLNEKYRSLQDYRRSIVHRIKSSQLPPLIQSIVMNIYTIRELGSENIEKEFALKNNNSLIRERDIEIATLSDQLQARDRILMQQKQLLQQNDITYQKPPTSVIKDSNLIMTSINATSSNSISVQLSYPNNQSIQSQNFSIDTDYTSIVSAPTSVNRKPYQQIRSSVGSGLNRSSQERGSRMVLKNAKSINDIQRSARPLKQRSILSAKSHEHLQNKNNYNQSPFKSNRIANKHPYLKAKNQKIFQLGSVMGSSPFRMDRQQLQREETSLNNSYSESTLSPASKMQLQTKTRSYQGGGNHQPNSHTNSAQNIDISDAISRKSLDLTPKTHGGGAMKKRSVSKKNSYSQMHLPNIQHRKNILEFNVHKSPYVQSFKDPEVAAQARKNKLMQLNLNLDHLKDLYTKKYFADS